MTLRSPAKISARSIVTAGLAITASTFALAIGADAQQAGRGPIELAQRGPGGGEELTPEERERRRQQRQQRRDSGGDGGGPRQRGNAGEGQGGPGGGQGGPGGGPRGPRTQKGEPQQLQQQAPPPPRVERFQRQAPPPPKAEQFQQPAPPPPRVERFQRQAPPPPQAEPIAPAGKSAIEKLPSPRDELLKLRRERFEERRERIQERREQKRDRIEERRERIDANREKNHERRLWRKEQRETERQGGFTNIDALKRSRRERIEGGRTIIEEPDARRIVRSGDRSYIIRDETRRLRRFGQVADTRRRPGGGNITEVVRPNGSRIFTETAPDGRLIRRYRRTRDGRTVILVDNRRTWRKWGAIGAGAVLATGLVLALDPPHYRIPRDRYIVEYDHASDEDIYDALSAPPVDDIEGDYTLDHVLFNYNLRARMRSVDLDTINFDTGAWDIDEGEYDKLERLARAIDRILERDSDEVFLIEGHTDAVGDLVSNRSLSDRRAEEVANILTEEFNIPPENLVIQGYGEEFLKVDTDGPSRANRRVTVRRITPLINRRSAEQRYRDR